MLKIRTKDKPCSPILMMVNADTSEELQTRGDSSQVRVADYSALQNKLGAEIIDRNSVVSKNWSRYLCKLVGMEVTLAVLAWTKRNLYQVFYCDAENNGLMLAFLFKLTFTRRAVFMIGHWITPKKKVFLFKTLRLHTHFTILFLHSSEQYKKVTEEMRVPASKVKMLPYQVDTEFWRPENGVIEKAEDLTPYICTAGLEFRDYSTLIKAIIDIPVRLKIGAASNWSKRKVNIIEGDLPSNVEVKAYNYNELRNLYAGSNFVVVPLVNVDFQAGITVILEAMAMGKAVIVTRSLGQGDTVIDRRQTTRQGVTLPTVGNLAEFFGDNEFKEVGQTGLYVSPGDADELRRAINFLLANPARTEQMGRTGRRMAETLVSVEQFAERIGQTIEKETGLDLSKLKGCRKRSEGQEECLVNGLPL